MKRTLLIISAMALTTMINAQAELTSWIMSTGLASYSYSMPPPGGTVNMTDSGDVQKVCYNTTDVYVQATGIAGTYVMGPWSNPNVPAAKSYTFKLTRNPTEELGTKTSVPLMGSIGVAVNGVVFYGYGDAKSYKSSTGTNEPNGDGKWYSDAWVSEGLTMDVNGNGHADGMSNYHYHANPIALYDENATTTHSPIIGFAYDGFPVYGPFGYTNPTNSSSPIKRIRSGYTLRAIANRNSTSPAGPTLAVAALGTYIEDYEHTGSNGDLDEYNGRFCHTPEYPSGTYAYFLATDANGDPEFPYLFASEYYGEVDNTSTNNNMPGGLTCGAPTVGVNEVTNLEQKSVLYPNPANNAISFSFNGELPNQLIITNTMGQVVMATTQMVNIDISNLPIGIYNATLLYSDNAETVRFVKN